MAVEMTAAVGMLCLFCIWRCGASMAGREDGCEGERSGVVRVLDKDETRIVRPCRCRGCIVCIGSVSQRGLSAKVVQKSNT